MLGLDVLVLVNFYICRSNARLPVKHQDVAETHAVLQVTLVDKTETWEMQ